MREASNPAAAEFPFECILDRVMLFSGAHTDYITLEPPACPRCKVLMYVFPSWLTRDLLQQYLEQKAAEGHGLMRRL